MEKELEKYKKLVEHLKTLRLCTEELDYTIDDEAFIDIIPFDMECYIDNWFKVEEIEEDE